ncbi:ATP-binding protein [Pseudomonas putida]
MRLGGVYETRGDSLLTIEVLRHSSEPKLTIAIADTGSGMSVSQRKRLFQPFTTTKQGGLGIGLVMVKRNRLANSPLSTQTSSDKNGWKTKPCPQVYPLNKPVSDVGHAEPASGSQSTMASLYTSAPHTP